MSLIQQFRREYARRDLVTRFQRETDSRRFAAEFRESDHPRDGDGKFAGGGSSGKASPGQPFYDASNNQVGRLLDGMTTAKMKAVLADLKNAGKNPEAQRTISAVLERRGAKQITQPPAAEKITDIMKKIEPGAEGGALVGMRDLRKQFPELSKKQFDEAMLAAAREGKISLHYHDFPTSLTQEERDELVFRPDPDSHTTLGGTFYIGAAIRKK